jgi:hypothetical protein
MRACSGNALNLLSGAVKPPRPSSTRRWPPSASPRRPGMGRRSPSNWPRSI